MAAPKKGKDSAESLRARSRVDADAKKAREAKEARKKSAK